MSQINFFQKKKKLNFKFDRVYELEKNDMELPEHAIKCKLGGAIVERCLEETCLLKLKEQTIYELIEETAQAENLYAIFDTVNICK